MKFIVCVSFHAVKYNPLSFNDNIPNFNDDDLTSTINISMVDIMVSTFFILSNSDLILRIFPDK